MLITLQNIAHHAQLAKSTVSMALRGHRRIGSATRERVQQLAQELGYRPNPLVTAHMASLRNGRSAGCGLVVGFVSPLSRSEVARLRAPHENYFFGARARAAELGIGVEYFHCAAGARAGRELSRILAVRGIEGVIVAPATDGGEPYLPALEWSGLATAAIGHAIEAVEVHSVGCDEPRLFRAMEERMAAGGFRRIGLALRGDISARSGYAWLGGMLAHNALQPPSARVPALVPPAGKWSQAAFLRWFHRHRPDALIVGDDEPVRWLRAAGFRVPGDVSCATLGWSGSCPELAGYYQNYESTGAIALDLVVAQLHRNERGAPAIPQNVLVQAGWRGGATLAAPPGPGRILDPLLAGISSDPGRRDDGAALAHEL